MIAFLEGILEEKTPSVALMNVNGVGYEVFISLGTYDRLPATGSNCRLLISHQVREDAQLLFGFANKEEKSMFERLITISGIGPKLAISVLSGLTVSELVLAISENDSKRISSVHGIGKKTAERIIIELRDKIDPLQAFSQVAEGGNGPQGAVLRDTALALESLGFSQDQARKMVQSAYSAHPEATGTEELLRFALKSK